MSSHSEDRYEIHTELDKASLLDLVMLPVSILQPFTGLGVVGNQSYTSTVYDKETGESSVGYGSSVDDSISNAMDKLS